MKLRKYVSAVRGAIILYFILKIEYRWEETHYNKTIDQIEEREKDDDKSCRLEKDARLGAILNTERTKANEGEDRERPEREREHREPAIPEASRRERVQLH